MGTFNSSAQLSWLLELNTRLVDDEELRDNIRQQLDKLLTPASCEAV